MSRQDGDEVWCGDNSVHAPHQWTSVEGARVGCPGFRHAPIAPKRETYTVEIDPVSGVTVFWRSEDPEYDGNDAAILRRGSAVYDRLSDALTRIKYLGER